MRAAAAVLQGVGMALGKDLLPFDVFDAVADSEEAADALCGQVNAGRMLRTMRRTL